MAWTEPRAVVRSTLPDAATVAPAREPTVASSRPRTAVRMPVRGEAGAGESIDRHAAGSEGIPARRCPRRRTGS